MALPTIGWIRRGEYFTGTIEDKWAQERALTKSVTQPAQKTSKAPQVEEKWGPGGYLYQLSGGKWYVPGSGPTIRQGEFSVPNVAMGWRPGSIVGSGVRGGERYNRLVRIAADVSGTATMPSGMRSVQGPPQYFPTSNAQQGYTSQPYTPPTAPTPQPTYQPAPTPTMTQPTAPTPQPTPTPQISFTAATPQQPYQPTTAYQSTYYQANGYKPYSYQQDTFGDKPFAYAYQKPRLQQSYTGI